MGSPAFEDVALWRGRCPTGLELGMAEAGGAAVRRGGLRGGGGSANCPPPDSGALPGRLGDGTQKGGVAPSASAAPGAWTVTLRALRPPPAPAPSAASEAVALKILLGRAHAFTGSCRHGPDFVTSWGKHGARDRSVPTLFQRRCLCGLAGAPHPTTTQVCGLDLRMRMPDTQPRWLTRWKGRCGSRARRGGRHTAASIPTCLSTSSGSGLHGP